MKMTKMFSLLAVSSVVLGTIIHAFPTQAERLEALDIQRYCVDAYPDGKVIGNRQVTSGGWHSPQMRNGRVVQHLCKYKYVINTSGGWGVNGKVGADGKVVSGDAGGNYGQSWGESEQKVGEIEPAWGAACKLQQGTSRVKMNQSRTRIFCVHP